MRAVFVGSGDWPYKEPIEKELAHLPQDCVIVTGGSAHGVEGLSADLAREMGLRVHVELSDWSRHGRLARAMRNVKILDDADAVYIFLSPPSDGRQMDGNADYMVAMARQKEVPVHLFQLEGLKSSVSDECDLNVIRTDFWPGHDPAQVVAGRIMRPAQVEDSEPPRPAVSRKGLGF
ncbi:MAG: hypothetical protein ACYCRD_04765 [Leptospirillum sp.]